MSGGAGLLRPPLVLLAAIILGVGMNSIWRSRLSRRRWCWGPCYTYRGSAGFRPIAKGISIGWDTRARKRTHHHDCSHRILPIQSQSHLSGFRLVHFGLAVSLNNLWLLVALAAFASFMSIIVIPREEHSSNVISSLSILTTKLPSAENMISESCPEYRVYSRLLPTFEVISGISRRTCDRH